MQLYNDLLKIKNEQNVNLEKINQQCQKLLQLYKTQNKY